MHISSLIVVFICTWWLTLFTVLPWGLRLDQSGPEVSGPGAPEKPGLKRKFVITTLIAVVVTGIIYALVEANVMDFYEAARQWSEEDYQ